MDPYLEDFWSEVHQSLVIYARDQLRSVLPAGLRARPDHHVFSLDDAEMVNVPAKAYVGATATGHDTNDRIAAWGGQGSSDHHDLSTPIAIEISSEPITQTYLEIRDEEDGGRIITAVAFISPAHKLTSEGRDLYLARQREYRAKGANIVEIDLTRKGDRYHLVVPRPIPARIRSTSVYLATVWRAKEPTRASIYAIPLSQRLPVILIPVRQGEDDVPLQLQPLLDMAYENGDYRRVINYRKHPEPALSPTDAAWVDGWLRGRGCR